VFPSEAARGAIPVPLQLGVGAVCCSRRKPAPNGFELPSQPSSRLSSEPSPPASWNRSPPAPAVKSVTAIAAAPRSRWSSSTVSLPAPVVIVLAK
jgi:hypothetical protein